ncbi:4-carboxy-4-hydroxy-2-oxoadipate aldolase/oxaloacetate decarboxylase [Anaerotruncus rubiinfantis]|uniref:4-carboxy-4-hydroxy-2-oxoadipate aldolase/oxaloacetate decarboxylase n=1 Tax=Anaerotruncus rubiinfantis TaxID=1720200 RepID=UPI0011C78803|nr:4-carboxy-4-hydroxy-2-oxoadipate aldolase/oxaloacetate decarboxylase [Anaerotruncus rubiinfantis]
MVHVRKTRPYLPDELVDRYTKQEVATVHEAMGKRGAMTHEIKPIVPGMRTCGRALTVKCHRGDNIMLIKAISMAQKGDVIVADMGTAIDNGPFGEVLAVECVTKGIAGLIVTGSVRDSMAIARLEFPVFSMGLSVLGTSKATLGTINHPIVCGGVQVNPGDLVLGDNDGVVVVPFEEAEEILAAANRRTESEAAVMERLRRGESLFDIYQYQKVFDSLHCIEEE